DRSREGREERRPGAPLFRLAPEAAERERAPDERLLAQRRVNRVREVAVEARERTGRVVEAVEHPAAQRHARDELLRRAGELALELLVEARRLARVTIAAGRVRAREEIA